MKRLRSIYEEYLTQIGRLEPIKLGGKKSHSAAKADHRYFINLFEKEIRLNRRVTWLQIGLICLLFLIGIFIILRNLDSIKITSVSCGGIFVFVLAALEKLRRVWRERVFIDVTLALIKELAPDDTAKVIETLYWSTIKK